MKSILTKASFLAILAVITICLASCNKNTERRLVGKWQLTRETVYCNKVEEDAFKPYPGVTDKYDKSGADWLKEIADADIEYGNVYEFYSNGEFYSKQKSGSWSGTFSVKADTIALLSENKAMIFQSHLRLLSDSKLELKYMLSGLAPAGSTLAATNFNHNHLFTLYYDKVK
jgi:hypothetical protein